MGYQPQLRLYPAVCATLILLNLRRRLCVVRAERERAGRRQHALSRFHANARHIVAQNQSHFLVKKLLAGVAMDLHTSSAVSNLARITSLPVAATQRGRVAD